MREHARERERGSEKIYLYRCDRALALTRPAHGTRVAGKKRPYGRTTRHQRQAKMLGNRKTEIATGEENASNKLHTHASQLQKQINLNACMCAAAMHV